MEANGSSPNPNPVEASATSIDASMEASVEASTSSIDASNISL